MKKKIAKKTKQSLGFTKKERVISIFIGLGIAILIFLSIVIYQILMDTKTPYFRNDLVILDGFFNRRIKTTASKPNFNPINIQKVALVVIDEGSIEKWPIPRETYSRLIEKLEKAGAKTIGFDIIFENPSDKTNDEILAKTLEKYDNIYIGHQIVEKKISVNEMETLDLSEDQVVNDKNVTIIEPIPIFSKALLKNNELHIGHVSTASDMDGIVRKIPLIYNIKGKIYPALSLLLVRNFLDISEKDVKISSDSRTILLGNYTQIPIYKGGATWINYFFSSKSNMLLDDDFIHLTDFTDVVPLKDILNKPDKEIAGWFQDRLVIVGATAEGAQDIKNTPFGSIPGVYSQLNMIYTILEGKYIYQPTFFTFFIVLFFIGIIVGLILPRINIITGSLLAIMGGVSIYQMSYLLFLKKGLFFPATAPILVLVFSFVCINLYHYQTERKNKSKLGKLLKEFAPMPAPYIEDYLKSKGTAKLGGVKHELTILFSDIRGYTDLSEKLDPVEVMNTLNEYHEAMGEIFEQNGGVIYDYQGDAQMVVFGLVEKSTANHALSACKSGIEMQEKLEELRAKWVKEGRHVFDVGVGICTGDVSLGVVGSAHRKQYAAIGDSTNVAARLQGKSKELDSTVLVSLSTYDKAKEFVDADALAPINLKGKSEAMAVFRIKGIKKT